MDSKDILFNGTIDSDTDGRYIGNGNFRSSTYMRSDEAGSDNSFSLKTAIGNALRINPLLPTGTNEFMGGVGWTERGLIVYAIYNSSNNHSWFYYNPTDQTHTLIFQDATLNFKIDRKLINVFIIDGVLYWTDGYFNDFIGNDFNPPRRLDIDKAIAGDYSADVFQVLDVVKWPPRFNPIAVYSNNATAPNLLRNNLYRFRYRYIYENEQYSDWSPISDLPLPNHGYFQDGSTGRLNNALQQNVDNVLDVTIDTGTIHVKKIEVAYQIGNLGQYYIFATLDKDQDGISSNTTYTVQYTGQETGTPVPLVIPNFTLVPQIAKAQEVIATEESPVISYGSIVEDYDGVDLDLNTKYYPRLAIDKLDAVKGIMPIVRFNNDTTLNQVDYDLSFGSENAFIQGDAIVFQLKDASNIVNTYVCEIQDATSLATVVADIISFFVGIGIFAASPSSGVVRVAGHNETFPTNDIGSNVVLRTVKPIPTFKLNSRYELGIKYEDRANREGATLFKQIDCIVDIPDARTVYDSGGFSPVEDQPFFVNLALGIVNLPPSWATHYRVMLRPYTPDFGYYVVYSTQSVEDSPTRKMISLENWYDTRNNTTSNHTIKVGDQLVFVRREPNFDSAQNYISPIVDTEDARFLTVYEYLPQGGVNGTDAIIVDWFDPLALESATTDSLVGCVVEIRTPKVNSENDVWYEVSESPILNPNTSNAVHGGSQIDLTVNSSTGTTVVVKGRYTFDNYVFNLHQLLFYNGTTLVQTSDITALPTYDPVTNSTTITVASVPVFTSVVLSLNQRLGVNERPATILIENGDIYMRPRWRRSGKNFAIGSANRYRNYIFTYEEDVAYSDFYISNYNSLGRNGLSLPDVKRKFQKAVVCHSKGLVDASNVNRLNIFDYTDRVYLSEEKGEVQRLILSGNTLSAIQDRKNNSIYIQKSLYVNGDGSMGLSNGSSVFASKRYKDEDWGTINPESVILVGGSIYYYDQLNKQIVKANEGGQEPISKTKRANTIVTALSEDVTSVWTYNNYDQNEVCFGFNNDGNYTHLSYNTSRAGFVTTYLDEFDGAVSFGSLLVGFKNGQLYEYNQGTDATFYDVLQEPTLTFVANNDPTLNKRFMAIGIKSTGNYELTSVKIPANQTYSEMESFIPSTSFRLLEGYAWASYKGDQNSPNFATPQLARLNGRAMRGTYATHLITQKSSGISVIFAVNVSTIKSESKI